MSDRNDEKPDIELRSKEIMQMESNLEKLILLTKDDKTEKALLRSRIDEQSRLIMMLKKRADDEIVKVLALEKKLELIDKEKTDIADQLLQEKLTSRMINTRFHELASNHHEMIQVKDEYKKRNASLAIDNERLNQEINNFINNVLQNKQNELDDKAGKLEKMNKQLEELKITMSGLQDKLDVETAKHKTELRELNERHFLKIDDLRQYLEQTNEKIKFLKDENDILNEKMLALEDNGKKELDKLSKEKQEMLDLAMQRGKIIHKEQNEKKEILQTVSELEKALKAAQDRFQKEAAAVDCNERVKALKSEIATSYIGYKELEKEYEAYKKHSESMLDKEKKLNATLRHLQT